MTVSKEITKLEKSQIRLSLTVPKEEVCAQYQKMLKDISKDLQIPGFRKGKVPQEVLERKYADSLKHDAMGRILESALKEVFEDKNINRNEKPLPYSTPELQEEPKLDLEQDFQFSVVYDVLPEVKIGKWKGLKAEHPYAQIENEDINRELENIRDRNAIVMDKDDNAPAKNGDVVTIDYCSLDESGEELTDTERKDFTYTLGTDTNVFKFDDDIIKMKKGETKIIEKNFPSDFEIPSMAGTKQKMRVTLTSLKEKKLPDLDDDLAQDVDEKFKTLDDLKNFIKEKHTKNLETRLREIKLDRLLSKIMENTPITLPESMIKMETNSRWQRLARAYQIDVEKLKEMMAGGNREEKEKEWRSITEKALHSRLIIETLIEELNIDVTDGDINEEIARIAAENNMEADELRKTYEDNQSLFYLKEDIKERRVTDILFAENTFIHEKKISYLDFMSDKD